MGGEGGREGRGRGSVSTYIRIVVSLGKSMYLILLLIAAAEAD